MKGPTFLALAVSVAAVDLVIPYLVLASTGSFWASFFFWSVITLAMIVFAGFYTRRWRNQ
jgi:LPXTG-motif cell wall-anchored protein